MAHFAQVITFPIDRPMWVSPESRHVSAEDKNMRVEEHKVHSLP